MRMRFLAGAAILICITAGLGQSAYALGKHAPKAKKNSNPYAYLAPKKQTKNSSPYAYLAPKKQKKNSSPYAYLAPKKQKKRKG